MKELVLKENYQAYKSILEGLTADLKSREDSYVAYYAVERTCTTGFDAGIGISALLDAATRLIEVFEQQYQSTASRIEKETLADAMNELWAVGLCTQCLNRWGWSEDYLEWKKTELLSDISRKRDKFVKIDLLQKKVEALLKPITPMSFAAKAWQHTEFDPTIEHKSAIKPTTDL